MEDNKSNSNALMIPVAIVIAGVLVAGAVIYSNNNTSQVAGTNDSDRKAEVAQPTGSTDSLRKITREDHIKGNPDAAVKIVEYSDFECPFCKRFHNTMNQVIDEYGKSGEVAWVYRHFPLDQLHPVKARAEAIASECAAELAGNDGFWEFADRFFELTPSNNQTNIDTMLPQIAQEIGLDTTKFEECMQSGRYDQHIEEDIQDAVATGGRGTPWSIVIAPNGKTFPLNGSQPYTSVKQLIELALKEK